MVEIVIVTREPKIKVLFFDPAAAQGEVSSGSGWGGGGGGNMGGALRLRAEASLLLGAVGVRKGRQPVALAAGYTKRRPPSSTSSFTMTQVIVVVTEGFVAMCFDHRLRLLWQRTISAPALSHAM